MIALVSVRKADEPADVEHPYGHEKLENLAAAIEGMLILVGAGDDRLRGDPPARRRGPRRHLGVGIAVIGFSALANFVVSGFLGRQARALGSPALEGDAAHLRDRCLHLVGVLVGLVLVADHRQRRLRLDRGAGRSRQRSSSPGCGSSPAPRGCWSTRRAGRGDGPDRGARSQRPAPPEMVGYHKLRARQRRAAAATSTCTCSSAPGPRLERAHELAHDMRDRDRGGAPATPTC